MSKIFIPTTNPEQWAHFLAEPAKHWKQGYSARTLAYCWQEADGFPGSVLNVLTKAVPFKDIEMILAIPEHQVALPGGTRPSQTDLWVLSRCKSGLVSIAVEGKVSEPFGPTVGEWLSEASPGKKERLNYLCTKLNIHAPPDHIRYQLIHRTVSAIIEAERYHAKHAVLLIHSFSQSDEWFDDYKNFAMLFNATAQIDEIISAGSLSNIELHLAWVRGKKAYLTK